MKTKRRILSLILAIALMISTWSVPVFAKEMTADFEIKAGETITVTTTKTTVKFVPEISGTYYLWSDSTSGDPCCYVYQDGDSTFYDDDILEKLGEKNNRYDFQFEYEFTAGETYFIELKNYTSGKTYEFNLVLSLVKHLPDAAEPYVEMSDTEGVTYQWYEVDVSSMEEITDESARTCTNAASASSSYDAGAGWKALLEYDYDEEIFQGSVFYKNFTSGESITIDLGDTDFESLRIFKTDGEDTVDLSPDEDTYGVYTLTAGADGEYGLFIDVKDIDFTLRAYEGVAAAKPLSTQTGAALQNPEEGKHYFCRIKTASGEIMETGDFYYKYIITEQPTKDNPSVKMNCDTADTVTYQWYTIAPENVTEVTPAIATIESFSNCTYSAVDGWTDGILTGDEGSYMYYMFSTELKAGQRFKVETEGKLTHFIEIADGLEGKALMSTGVEDDTYVFDVDKDGSYVLIFFGETNSMAVRAYIVEPEQVEGETGERLLKEEPGNSYFCMVKAGEKLLKSEEFTAEYRVTHQPVKSEPYVEVNKSEGVTYQWYHMDVSAAEKVDLSNAVDVFGAEYDEEEGWSSAGLDMYMGFFAEVDAGEKLTVHFDGKVDYGVGLLSVNDALNGYFDRHTVFQPGTGIDNDIYQLAPDSRNYYFLTGYSEDNDLTAEAWLGNVTLEAISGACGSTFEDAEDGEIYFCRMKTEDREFLQSDLLDLSYTITHQPTKEESYVEADCAEDIKEVRWYRETPAGEEITPGAIAYGDFDEENGYFVAGWSGISISEAGGVQKGLGLWGYKEMTTGESLTIKNEGILKGFVFILEVDSLNSSNLNFAAMVEDHEVVNFRNGGVCTLTAPQKGDYYIGVIAGMNDPYMHIYAGGTTTAAVEVVDETGVRNNGEGFYYSEVEYNNGKVLKSDSIHFLTMLDTPENPALEMTGDKQLTASWKAVENASGYEITVYKDGKEFYSCSGSAVAVTGGAADVTGSAAGATSGAANVTGSAANVTGGAADVTENAISVSGGIVSAAFDITEKGSYTFSVEALGDDRRYDNSEKATSGALNIYGVTFDANGGGTDPEEQLVAEGGLVTEPATAPSKQDYPFDGWYNGKTKWDFATPVTGDLNLKAKFTGEKEPSQPATGSVQIGNSIWSTLATKSAAELLFTENQKVVIAVTDSFDEDVTVEYFISDTLLTAEQLDGKTFTAYTEPVNITENGTYFVYAKLTNDSGDVTYISSEGFVLDKTALGDVDTNGEITAEDALKVLKSVAHMITLDKNETRLADVNRDGDVSAEDALQILKYVAHMITEF